MTNPDQFIKELIQELTLLVKAKYGQESKAIKNDITEFIESSSDKLYRWYTLLESEKLTLEEFALLVRSQKDLFIIQSLHKAGVSRISLGHFKNSIVSVIINTAFKFLL